MAPRNPELPPTPLRHPQPQRPTIPRLFSRLSHASKRSFRSYSSSFEADDERSGSDSRSQFDSDSDSDMDTSTERGQSRERRRRRSYGGEQYADEDTRPTSEKELAGWYMYSFAAETYVICGRLNQTIHDDIFLSGLELPRPRSSAC